LHTYASIFYVQNPVFMLIITDIDQFRLNNLYNLHHSTYVVESMITITILKKLKLIAILIWIG